MLWFCTVSPYLNYFPRLPRYLVRDPLPPQHHGQIRATRQSKILLDYRDSLSNGSTILCEQDLHKDVVAPLDFQPPTTVSAHCRIADVTLSYTCSYIRCRLCWLPQCMHRAGSPRPRSTSCTAISEATPPSEASPRSQVPNAIRPHYFLLQVSSPITTASCSPRTAPTSRWSQAHQHLGPPHFALALPLVLVGQEGKHNRARTRSVWRQ